MSSVSSSPSLKTFDPHAVHFFTSASSDPTNATPAYPIPKAAYPSHIILASSASSSGPPPNSANSQGSPSSLTRPLLVPIQAPQPLRVPAKGIDAFGRAKPAAKEQKKDAIFEPFDMKKRPVTPELDAVLKKRTAQWGFDELEESLKSN